MSGSSPQALFNQREEIAKQLREIMAKKNPNISDQQKFKQLENQWSNIDGKLHEATLAYIHTLLYNPNTQSIKIKNNLQKIVNTLAASTNNFNKNAKPILDMYKDYLTRTNLASNENKAKRALVAASLNAEKIALQQALKAQKLAFEEQAAGHTAEAARIREEANKKVASMQAAHQNVLSTLENNKKTKLLELEAQKKAIEVQAKANKEAANQTARKLEAAKEFGNAEAQKAARLANNIAKRNVEATERNAKIAAAEAALAKAKQNAEAASVANKAAANKALANKQEEFNRQLAANKAAANKALAAALESAAKNKNSVVAQAAANKAAADAAAAEAAQRVSQLEAAGTASVAALRTAKNAANAAQAKANQEATKLRNKLRAKSEEANRLAESLAEASRAGANAEQRFRAQLLISKETEAKATRAKLATLAAQLEVVKVVKSRGNAAANAAAAKRLANAHKAEANAAKKAAANAAAATESAKKLAANRQAEIIALQASVEAGKVNTKALINVHAKASAASAAAVAAAQAEQQAAKEELEALQKSSSATKAELNAAMAAIIEANANKTATVQQHAANMARLKANANSGTAAAIESLRAARAANKAAANRALANLRATSAQNVTTLQTALKNLNAKRQAELEAKGTEKEAAVVAARMAAELTASAKLSALQENLKKAKQEASNIIKQKDSNLNQQKKAAEAQVEQLEAELSKAKTLVGAVTLTGMALGRTGGAVVGGIGRTGGAIVGGLTRLTGLRKQINGPNTGRTNVPPTGLGTVTPLPLRLENNPLIKRVQNTITLIGNKGHKNTRNYLIRYATNLKKSPNNKTLQNKFVKQVQQWAVSSSLKNNALLRETKIKQVTISNFNTFVKNYLGKLNKPNNKALIVRTPNAVPASAGPNFTNVTIRWLNNWKRYSNDELIKGVPGASVNGKVNPETASGQTRLKLLNIVRNANIVFSKPGAIAYFVKKYKDGGEKDPYLKWLIETMIGPQILAFKNSNNYTRALQWVRKVHGINAGTLNVNKYNQYINNSYLPNKLKQALLKHKTEILNKRGSGTVLGKENITQPAGNPTVLGVPSKLNSKNVGKPPSVFNKKLKMTNLKKTGITAAWITKNGKLKSNIKKPIYSILGNKNRPGFIVNNVGKFRRLIGVNKQANRYIANNKEALSKKNSINKQANTLKSLINKKGGQQYSR